MTDYPISELRIVKVYFKGSGHHNVHYMHEREVNTFVRATKELHYIPGINPHRNGKTSELWEIYVQKLSLDCEALWWSTPGLNGSHGAKMHKDYVGQERVFAHPELLAQEKVNQDMEDYYD